MNDNITKLIETLAAKLGTTAEYLWGVLIKQAHVSATTDLICATLFAAYLIIFSRWMIRRGRNTDDSFGDIPSDIPIAMLGGLTAIVSFILILFCIPNIITGFMNPEYWALEQILKKL